MKLNFTGDIDDIIEGVKKLAVQLGYTISTEGIIVGIGVCVKGLEIEGNGEKFSIRYHKKTDFFRGLAILVDRIKNNEFEFCICESNKFDTCGIMVDVSRNAVLKVETVKDIIRRMALMGLNRMMLYTEDTYKIDKYPYFGYMRGAYTRDELKDIDGYASIYGVENVPCIQTLAHLGRTLRWRYAKEIKDTADVLLIDEPKTYEFIEEMIKTVSECFSSRKIHIGMDEALGVGFGQYFNKHGYVNKFDLLSRHLTKVVDITKKYGLEPMMWSDMFFRLGSKTNEYYDIDAVMPDDISGKIPDNISMVYWDYYNENVDMYRAMVKGHKKMNRDVIFAGGVWTWNGVAINYTKTFATTKHALEICREENIKDVFTTMWGDDGAECSIYTALLGMQLYAEYNYYDHVDNDHLRKMFKTCTNYDMDAFLLFDADAFSEGETKGENAVTLSKQILYQDILQGLFDKNLEYIEAKKHYENILNKFEQMDSQGDIDYLLDYQKQLIKVLYQKCDIGIRISNAYKDKNIKILAGLNDDLGILKKDIKILHSKLSEIWYKNNKGFGLDVLDIRFGGLIMRVERAFNRIEDFVCGRIDKIEELDEEKLMYNEDGNPFVHNYFSSTIVSV